MTISETTKISLKNYVWLIGMVIYITLWCAKIDMDVRNSVTNDQAQQWLFNQEMANKSAFPALVWTQFPQKEQRKDMMDYVLKQGK